MSVIVEASLPAEAFELGRILRVEGSTQVSLETMVPLGGRPTPLVRVRNDARESFEAAVRDHPSVDGFESVASYDAETLYRLTWTPSDETLLGTLLELDGTLLAATGGAERWNIDVRFPSNDLLSAFQEHYTDEGIPLTVERVYKPTESTDSTSRGLTRSQREGLTLAVSEGYYRLPREVSTQELAEELDISDQAVTERLRRGITSLVENTLLVAGGDS
ncbi:helix-turn-helix domain-containing protein [Natronomonas amylolytica]|uniref:helix-turn-helix domain-containing protein n=1 Tax=Natronomonas amylolytica TaxID=3108498 RepID=UPI003008AE4E